MNCKDCVWWVGMYCTNESKIHEGDYLLEEDNKDELCYTYNELGSFQTGPMFGCVHFKNKVKSV